MADSTASRTTPGPTIYNPRPGSWFPASGESAPTAAASAMQPTARVPGNLPRALRNGEAGILNEEQLLGVILGAGKSEDILTLAREVADSGIFADPARQAPASRWWGRLGPVRASRLLAALELVRRSAGRGGTHLDPPLRSPAEVYDATADLRPHRREHFVGLYLNSRNRLLARETVSVGSLNASIVHPREVYEPALRHGAASLVVVHNHPSGETDPSEDDLSITRRLLEAGEILGIALLDHVIVGRRGYTSLKELGHL